jgi:hypothetical protein
MRAGTKEDARKKSNDLLFVIFLFDFIIILGKIAIFRDLFLLIFFIFVVVNIFGDEIEMDRMNLGDLEFRLAFWATEDLAFFDLVLVDVDFCGAFGAANHSSSSRT